MKNVVFIFAMLFGSIALISAQARPGIKLGLNNSNISNTSLDAKNNIYIGAFLNIPITEYYTLQPEVLYSAQGGASNSTQYGDVTINYLSIGIPNKFYVGPNSGFHFMVGLSLDFNIDNSFISLTNGNSNFDISPLDVALLGGIGYDFDFGLMIEARYKQGTSSTDFFGQEDLYEKDGSNLNTVIQIGLAYKFKI